MTIKTILFIPVLLMLVSGCAGVGVLYPGEWYDINKPAIGSTSGHYYKNQNNKEFTCEQVEKLWGQPDVVTVEGGKTVLVYKNGLVFAGVMPFVVIPIPLALPVGQKNTTIECENGVVVRAYKTGTTISAAYCGMISEKPEFGCQAE